MRAHSALGSALHGRRTGSLLSKPSDSMSATRPCSAVAVETRAERVGPKGPGEWRGGHPAAWSTGYPREPDCFLHRTAARGARARRADHGRGCRERELSVANVALPTIGKEFDSSQTTLNLIAVGYSLGLAASVLYSAPSAIATAASCCWSSAWCCRCRPAARGVRAVRRGALRARVSSAASRPGWRIRRRWR